MIKKGLLLILLLNICFCTACSKEQEVPVYTEFTMREDGEPYSDWKQATTGSAKYLDGDSVLVTIYVDTEESNWNVHNENIVKSNTKTACDYLKEQGKLYGKDVNLIYDSSIYSDLEYRMSFDITRQNDENDSYSDELANDVYDFIESEIDTKSIMEKYQVNSIGYMVFVDGTSDKCLAYPFYETSRVENYTEFCIIYLRWSMGDFVDASTYAHEILHLFGAKDLYHTSDYTGIYKDFVKYADEKYGNDIMLGSYADKVYGRDIRVDITKLTAYFLGWRDYISELETFPSIKTREPACFCLTEHSEANYEEFSLVDSSNKQNIILKIIYAVFVVLAIYRVVSVIRADIKIRKDLSKRNANIREKSNNNLNLNDMNKFYMQDIPYDVLDEISDKND